jgi:hypothetical protein
MISENTRPGIAAVVSNTRDSKLILEVMPNTPLSHLVVETTPVVTPTVGLEAEAVYQQTELTDITGVNRHEMVLDEVVGTLGEAIVEQMRMVRCDVIPMVKRVTSLAIDAANEVKLGEYVIETFFLSEIHDNEAIVELLSRWDSFPAGKVISPIGFQKLEESEVIALAATGSPRLDEPMAEMIGKHPAGWATAVYEEYFGITDVKTFTPVVQLNSMDEWLLAHFIARNLADNPQEGSGLSLLNHNNFCATLMAQLAVAMTSTHKNWDFLRTSGSLVLSWPIATDIPIDAKSAVIQVIGDNYNNFLGAGGSPEILIGASMDDRPYSGAAFTTNSERYQKQYVAYKNRLAIYRERQLGGVLRTALNIEIAKEVLTLPEGLLENSISIEKMQAHVTGLLGSKLDHELVGDLYMVAREVICKVIYGHTSALEIAEKIDAVMTKRSCDGRRAAYYVAIDLLLEYWLNQTTPKYQ